MSKMISDLLGAREPAFSLTLRRLEQLSGRPSLDVRLTAEIVAKLRQVTAQLGLDPDDTVDEELYFALLNLARQHDEHLLKHLGASNQTSYAELGQLLQELWSKLNLTKTVWSLKPSVAKQLLKKTPPRAVMKQLGYRSVDSLLKREKLAEIYGGMRLIESADWLKNFNQTYRRLKPSDFQTNQVEIFVMPVKRWQTAAAEFMQQTGRSVTHIKELGVLFVLPVRPILRPGDALLTLGLLSHQFNEIRSYSAFFKLQQVKPDFGNILAKTLNDDPGQTVTLAGQPLHWRVLQHFLGQLGNHSHSDIFEPHVQSEDLAYHKTEDLLSQVDPNLSFWQKLDYAARPHHGRPQSLNVLDLAASLANQLPHTRRSVYYCRESLWNELFSRYLGQAGVGQQALGQLDSNMVT